MAVIVLLAMPGPPAVASQEPASEGAPLVRTAQMPLPGVIGRIDHFSADDRRRLLIFAGLGNNSVEVVNTFELKLVRSLKGLDEPQGVLYVPGVDKIFVANAGNRTVHVFDGKTYAVRKTIEVGEDPDNIRWDEASKRVFVGMLGAIAQIDPATEQHVGQDLKTAGGHAESFQLEKKGSRIFVNVPSDDSTVQVIDRKTGQLTKWGLNGAKANFPMALDEDDHRLFVVTRNPPLVIVLDTTTGKEVARVRAAAASDDVYFDPARKRIYAICGQGFITVVQQKDPDHYAFIGNVPTTVGVRTGYLQGGNLYVAVPVSGNEPAQLWTYTTEE
jgi:YVTN family beta-propeller protein